jgi:hypothetical protein
MAVVWVSSSQNIASACLAAIFLHRLLFFSSNLCLIWQQQDMQFSVGQTIQETMLTVASTLKMEAAGSSKPYSNITMKVSDFAMIS